MKNTFNNWDIRDLMYIQIYIWRKAMKILIVKWLKIPRNLPSSCHQPYLFKIKCNILNMFARIQKIISGGTGVSGPPPPLDPLCRSARVRTETEKSTPFTLRDGSSTCNLRLKSVWIYFQRLEIGSWGEGESSEIPNWFWLNGARGKLHVIL